MENHSTQASMEKIEEKRQKVYMNLKSLGLLDRHIDRVLDEYNKQKRYGVVRKQQQWQLDPEKLAVEEFVRGDSSICLHRGVYERVNTTGDRRGRPTRAAVEEAFRREVTVRHKLNHPNIAKFIGAIPAKSEADIQRRQDTEEMAKDVWCIVSEYIPGCSLESYLIKNKKHLSLDRVLQLTTDVARGISYLHSKNIVHRAINIEDMVLDENERVKIAEFGFATYEPLNPNGLTGDAGTPTYMAPEVLQCKPYNRKCDVYSFGICLWKIYCRGKPYGFSDFTEATKAVVDENRRPVVPKSCPRSLVELMTACWEADPEKRPEMKDVLLRLEAVTQADEEHSSPPNPILGCLFSK